MSKDDFQNILKRYQEGNCTEEEILIVEGWYNGLGRDKNLQEIEESEWKRINKSIWRNIGQQIKKSEIAEKPGFQLWPKIAIAASVSIVLIISAILIKVSPAKPSFTSKGAAIEVSTKINEGNVPISILLKDGSNVTLQPGATLSYPKEFESEKREVYVSGEALFEINRDPNRPFYVFSDQLITKVVGTSFIVRSEESGIHNEVEVLSGQVLVSKNIKKSLAKDVLPGNESIHLMPNYRAVYNKKSKKLAATIVKNPVPLNVEKKEKAIDFHYQNVSLGKVIKEIELTYGIEIIAESSGIYNCTFTGDLNGLDIYTKLDLICKSVGVSYETEKTTIKISGEACSK